MTEFQDTDRFNQEVFSLVKVRLYMTKTEWSKYKRNRIDRGADKQTFDRADVHYGKYKKEMLTEMKRRAAFQSAVPLAVAGAGMEELRQAAAAMLPGGALAPRAAYAEAKQADLLMSSSNRRYEAKLKVIAAERQLLKKLIEEFNRDFDRINEGTRTTRKMEIEDKLVRIRKLVLEASLYANEASVTHGTVHHGVVGLQSGGQIHLTHADLMHAVNEHMADALKETGKHPHDLGEAVYKAAKYLWRMCDAAKNCGFGALSGVERLYQVCFKIAEQIKGSDESNPVGTSLSVFTLSFPSVTNVLDLRRFINEMGTRIANASNLMRARPQELAQATPPKKTYNPNM